MRKHWLKKKNITKQGTNSNETLSHIFNHFNKEEYKINHELLIPDNAHDAVIAALTHDNMYTLGWLERNGAIGHSVIIARIDRELYILDPQQQSGYCGLVAIEEYLRQQHIVRIRFIYKSISKEARHRYETKTQIRKKSSTDSPEYKKQKISPKILFNIGAPPKNLPNPNKKKTFKKKRGGSNKTAKRSRL